MSSNRPSYVSILTGLAVLSPACGLCKHWLTNQCPADAILPPKPFTSKCLDYFEVPAATEEREKLKAALREYQTETGDKDLPEQFVVAPYYCKNSKAVCFGSYSNIHNSIEAAEQDAQAVCDERDSSAVFKLVKVINPLE